MGFMNLLKANYTGKLGETVGQGWNDKHIIRAYQESKPSNSEEQQEQKELFQNLVKSSAMLWQSQYNMKPPSNYKGNPFNYLCKAFYQLMELDLRLENGVKMYCTSPKPVLYPYIALYNDKTYFVFNRSLIGHPKYITKAKWKTVCANKRTFTPSQWIPPNPENAILDVSFPQMSDAFGFSKQFLYETGKVLTEQDFFMYQVDIKTKTRVYQSMLFYGMTGMNLSNQTAVPNE